MNSRQLNSALIGLAFSAIAFSSSSFAQTKDGSYKVIKDSAAKKSNSVEKTIIIKDDGKEVEKMTVIVNGDKVTINGKPVENWKEEDLAKLHHKKIIVDMHGMNGMNMKMPPFEVETDVVSNRAVLGVVTEKNEKGALVKEVNKESAAAKAGLQANDIITKVNDTKIADASELYSSISKFKPEDKVTVTYLRDGKEKTTSATLGKGNNVKVRSMHFDKGDFDFNIPNFEHNFNFNDNQVMLMNPGKPKLGLQIQDQEDGNGVKVLDVDSDLAAAKAGLKEGDIITEINGKELKSVDDLKAKLRERKDGDTIKLSYKRNGKLQTAEIKIPKKLKKADL